MKRLWYLACVLVMATSAQAGELLVSAASSLTNAFTDLARSFEQSYPQISIKLNFAASGVMLQQLAHGAPVDVFATADEQTMNQAQSQSLIDPDTRQNFAQNDLVLIRPIDQTSHVHELADLHVSQVHYIALGDPRSVPVGRYAKLALEQAHLYEVLKNKYILTQNVRQSLDYVARGEVDMGFVYRTDAYLKPKEVAIQMVVPLSEVIRYPIALTKQSQSKQEAQAFIDYVRSEKGLKILAKYGFTQP